MYCQEILGTIHDSWTAQFWEQQLNYTKMNFTYAYLGEQNLKEVVLKKTAAGGDFIFQWWTPDPLLVQDAQRIMFEPDTEECRGIGTAGIATFLMTALAKIARYGQTGPSPGY